MKSEILAFLESRLSRSDGATPMDIGAIDQGKGKRFEGTCNHCGKKGHMVKDCWAAAADQEQWNNDSWQSPSKGDSGQSPSKGKDKGKGKGKKGKSKGKGKGKKGKGKGKGKYVYSLENYEGGEGDWPDGDWQEGNWPSQDWPEEEAAVEGEGLQLLLALSEIGASPKWPPLPPPMLLPTAKIAPKARPKKRADEVQREYDVHRESRSASALDKREDENQPDEDPNIIPSRYRANAASSQSMLRMNL
jgi:hypothetical protein